VIDLWVSVGQQGETLDDRVVSEAEDVEDEHDDGEDQCGEDQAHQPCGDLASCHRTVSPTPGQAPFPRVPQKIAHTAKSGVKSSN
jgi:hypothetical protein